MKYLLPLFISVSCFAQSTIQLARWNQFASTVGAGACTTPAFVQVASTNNLSLDIGTLIEQFTNPVTAGNSIIVLITTGAADARTYDTVTNTQGDLFYQFIPDSIFNNAGGGGKLSAFYTKNVTGGTCRVGATQSGGTDAFSSMQMWEVSCIDTPDGTSVATNTTTGANQQIVGGNLTTTNANDFLVALGAAVTGPLTAGTNMIMKNTSASFGEYTNLVAVGTYNPTFTNAANADRWGIIAAAFKPGPATGPIVTAIVSNPGVVGCDFTWTTEVPSTSAVIWGTTSSYGNTNTVSGNVKSHEVFFEGLTASTTYHYAVVSKYQSLTTQTADATFATAATISYLVSEDDTGGSTPTGWTNHNAGIDWGYTANPIEGTYSLEMTSASSPFTEKWFASTNRITGFIKFRFPSAMATTGPRAAVFSDGSSDLGGIIPSKNGGSANAKFGLIYNGSVQGSATVDGQVPATVGYVWWSYNGVEKNLWVYWSTNGVLGNSGNQYYAVSPAGTSAAVQRIVLQNNNSQPNFYFDHIRVANGTNSIGSFPN